MKYPKNAKLGLPQKVGMLGKIRFQIGFCNAQKTPYRNIKDI